MWNSKVVILDEPTAALGVAQTRQVLELVRRLAEQNLAVVIISHNLHDIFEVVGPDHGLAPRSASGAVRARRHDATRRRGSDHSRNDQPRPGHGRSEAVDI